MNRINKSGNNVRASLNNKGGGARVSRAAGGAHARRAGTALLSAVICAALLLGASCGAAYPPGGAGGAYQGGAPGAANAAGVAGNINAEFISPLKTLSMRGTAGAAASAQGTAAGVSGAASPASAAAASPAGTNVTGSAGTNVTGSAETAADLSKLTILAVNSSRAVINGKLADLVSDMPGASSYLRDGRTYVPAEYIEKSFGLVSSHNEDKGMYRLKKGDKTILTLNASEYDYAMDANGEIVLFIPLRKAVEALGKTVSYYDGVIAIGDGPSPIDPARHSGQIAELRASLTGTVSVGTADRFEKLMQSADMTYYGRYESYLEQARWQRSWGRNNMWAEDIAAPDVPMLMGPGEGAGAPGADAGMRVQAETAAATTVASAAAKPAAPPAPSPTGPPNALSAFAEEKEMAADSIAQAKSAENDEYSTTNIQVQGVDESDVVKTDGRYIYQVNNRRILIIDAYPPSGMKLAGQVDFEKQGAHQFEPLEMYVDGDTLVVIGSSYRRIAAKPAVRSDSKPGRDIVEVEEYYPYYDYGFQSTKVFVYDMKDRGNLKLIRESDIEGSYKSSRKIGGALYVVANKPLYYYGPYPYYDYAVDDELVVMPAARADGAFVPTPSPTPMSAPVTAAATTVEAKAATTMATTAVAFAVGPAPAATMAPAVSRSADRDMEKPSQTVAYSDSATTGGAYADVAYPSIYYFPGCVSRNYLIVAGIDTRDINKPISVETILDYGENIYVSPDYLYVATQNSGRYYWNQDGAQAATTTAVHRFALSGGSVVYDGKGEVAGRILNQFSMDESDGYLRVATTSDTYDSRRGYHSQNNLYILDKDLKIAGKLEGLAPGEIIYSVRFIGTRGYVVTFKTVDPLFVIDLSDPKNPKVLGALKIPGYSDYLHPYDENHIIGFGKDTATKNYGYGDIAYYQGMKIALFDVSDVANPKELFTEFIGDRGTDSELLRNHRALLFSKERELLAFPVTVMTLSGSSKSGKAGANVTDYGHFEFQGAYVYKLNLKEGFTLKGKITHISPEEYMKYGSYYWGGEDNAVERLLYIRESLYALSKAFITSCEIANPSRETGRLALGVK